MCWLNQWTCLQKRSCSGLSLPLQKMDVGLMVRLCIWQEEANWGTSVTRVSDET